MEPWYPFALVNRLACLPYCVSSGLADIISPIRFRLLVHVFVHLSVITFVSFVAQHALLSLLSWFKAVQPSDSHCIPEAVKSAYKGELIAGSVSSGQQEVGGPVKDEDKETEVEVEVEKQMIENEKMKKEVRDASSHDKRDSQFATLETGGSTPDEEELRNPFFDTTTVSEDDDDFTHGTDEPYSQSTAEARANIYGRETIMKEVGSYLGGDLLYEFAGFESRQPSTKIAPSGPLYGSEFHRKSILKQSPKEHHGSVFSSSDDDSDHEIEPDGYCMSARALAEKQHSGGSAGQALHFAVADSSKADDDDGARMHSGVNQRTSFL